MRENEQREIYRIRGWRTVNRFSQVPANLRARPRRLRFIVRSEDGVNASRSLMLRELVASPARSREPTLSDSLHKRTMPDMRDRRFKLVACVPFGVLVAGVLGCYPDWGTTEAPPPPPVVIQLVPGNATVTVGDTIDVVSQITGGSVMTPPSLYRCTSTSPNVATAIWSRTACRVAGLANGTTDIVAMASTGHQDTATVVVVPR